MKQHRIHLAIAAASIFAAACSSTPFGQRSASADRTSDSARTGVYTGPGAGGSGVAVVPQSGGAPVAGAERIGAAPTDGAMARQNNDRLSAYDRAGSGQPVATKDPAPNILVPATGSGAGSSTANSNVPTGEYTGPGPAGSGTALPNLGRSSESIARQAHGEAVDQRQMSELIGADVRDAQGEKIGDIEEVLLDANGQPSVAIVSTGGFIGIGESKHAVPFTALQIARPGSTDRTLDMTREQLRQAPSFSDAQRSMVNDPAWMERNTRAYTPR